MVNNTLIFDVFISSHRSRRIFSDAAMFSFARCSSTACLSVITFRSRWIFCSISLICRTRESHFSVRSVFSASSCSIKFWWRFTIVLYLFSNSFIPTVWWRFCDAILSHAALRSDFNWSFKHCIVAFLSSICNLAVSKSSRWIELKFCTLYLCQKQDVFIEFLSIF